MMRGNLKVALRGRKVLMAAAAAAAIGVMATSVDADLTHRYSFNDDTASDSVGGANGTLVNPSGGASISGGQVNFSNTGTSNNLTQNNYVDLPNNIAKTQNFTIEGWASWGGGSVWERIFDFGSNSGGEEIPGSTTAGYTGTNYIFLTPKADNVGAPRLGDLNGEIRLNNNSTFVDGRDASNAPFSYGANDGEHMFALTFDFASQKLSLYYDGSLVSQNSTTVNTDPSTIDQVNMWLGRSNFAGDSFFNGSINEFRIYNNALSAAQIGADRGFGPDALGPTGTNVWQTAGSGNFANDPSWSLGHVPTSTEKSQIPNGANVTVNSDVGTNAVVQITSGTLTLAPNGLLTTSVDLAPGNGPGSANLVLNGGALTVAQISVDNGATGGTGTKTVSFNGGTLVTTQSFALAGSNLTTTVGAGGANIQTQTGSVVTWNPALAAAPGATLTKGGSGSLILQTGGFNGAVTIQAGTLSVAGDVGTSSATLQLGDPTTTGGDSATLAFSAPATLRSPLMVGSTSGFGTYNLNVSANTAVSIPTTISLNQALSINTVATSGTNGLSITGGITSASGDSKTLTFNNAGSVAVTGQGISDGTGGQISLLKTNGGLLTLGAANTYTGMTQIDGGGILFLTPSAIGGSGSSVFVNVNGIAAAGPAFTNLTSTFFNRIDPGSQGVLALTTNTSEDFHFDELGFGQAILGAGTNVTYTGTLTPNSGAYRLGGGGGVLTLPNVNALTSSNILVVGGAGGGTVVLGAANDFSGSINIRQAAVLSVSNPASLGTGTDAILFNNGTLQITGTTPFSSSRPLMIDSGGATVLVDNNASATFSGGLTNTGAAGNNALFKRGLGTLTLTGTVDNGNNSIFVNAGTLIFDTGAVVTHGNYASIGQLNNDVGTLIVRGNAQYTNNGDFNVSDVGNSKGALFIQDTAQVKARTFFIGKTGTSQGVAVQTGGSLGPNATPSGDWRIGGSGGTGDVASSGTYDLNGGTFTTAQNFQIGAFGTGGMTLRGGSATVSAGFPVVGRFTGGYGTLTVSAGSFTQGNGGTFLIVGEQGTGVVNVNGTGVLDVQGPRLRIGHTNLGNGVVNLGTGGLIKAKIVDTAADTNGAFVSLGSLNFHGGTLQATAASPTFINTTTTNIWPEGGIIDSNGFDLTIARPLVAPAGSGIASVAIATPGTAYTGTPVIKITGGGGSNATAVPVITGGQLTGIQITNPGVGYTSTPTIQIVGGGGSSAAAGAVTLAANASGGITKTGLGTLTLSAANTFTGDATVNGGTLKVTGSLAGGVVANNGGTFNAGVAQTIKTLTVNSGGQAVVSAGPLKVGNNSAPLPLSVAANGKVDVKNSGIIVDYQSSGAASDNAALTSVRTSLIAGYGTGDWKGNGITSSSITTGQAVGYALASEVLPFTNGVSDTFLGSPVDKSSVVARYTLAGDATLDGAVDFNDLVKLAQNYNTTVSTSSQSWWNRGDFTYDGTVDFNDLVKLAQNYNTALPTGAIPGATPGFEQDLARAFASVPEPSAAVTLLLAGGGMMLRRRRRCR
jgi:autotransporter-associated beta strand protein